MQDRRVDFRCGKVGPLRLDTAFGKAPVQGDHL
jgi:hypothetical protein